MHDYMGERFIRLLFKDSFTEEPKRYGTGAKFNNSLGFSHIAFIENDYNRKNIKFTNAVRTFKSFNHYADDRFSEYYTPNTFYSAKNSTSECLRWINTLAIDIDKSGINVIDILWTIRESGLPDPTAINKTPNGWHIYWVLKERVKATLKSMYLCNLIQGGIAKRIEGDSNAIGCNRLFRLPNNLRYFREENTYLLSELQSWYHEEFGSNNNKEYNRAIVVKKYGLLQSDAVKELLKGVTEGQRNAALYCLSMVYKYEGYSMDDTIQYIVEWNQKNSPKLEYGELLRTIKSAYKNNFNVPTKWISRLTGKNFKSCNFWYKHKKIRKDRSRHHYNERIDDIAEFLMGRGGSFEGSQRELSEAIFKTDEYKNRTTPLSSLKECLRLIREGLVKTNIKVEVIGKGRYARTILTLVKAKVIVPKIFNDKTSYNNAVDRNRAVRKASQVTREWVAGYKDTS